MKGGRIQKSPNGIKLLNLLSRHGSHVEAMPRNTFDHALRGEAAQSFPQWCPAYAQLFGEVHLVDARASFQLAINDHGPQPIAQLLAYVQSGGESLHTVYNTQPLMLSKGSPATREHLIERLRKGEVDGFGAIFEVVECWHLRGDHYVREAATIGLLESLQNQLGGNDRDKPLKGVRASDFERWLQPETRNRWDKLYRLWDGDVLAFGAES